MKEDLFYKQAHNQTRVQWEKVQLWAVNILVGGKLEQVNTGKER